MSPASEDPAFYDDWFDSTPIPCDASEQEKRENDARVQLADGVASGRLPDTSAVQWAVPKAIMGDVGLVGHVLLATSMTTGGGLVEIDPLDVQAALQLLGPAARNMDRLEARVIMIARNQHMTWRTIAESLGLQSPQAAAQRWQRLTGASAPGSIMRQRVISALVDGGVTSADLRVWLGHERTVILQLGAAGSPAARQNAASKVITALRAAGLDVTDEASHSISDMTAYLADCGTAEVTELDERR